MYGEIKRSKSLGRSSKNDVKWMSDKKSLWDGLDRNVLEGGQVDKVAKNRKITKNACF